MRGRNQTWVARPRRTRPGGTARSVVVALLAAAVALVTMTAGVWAMLATGWAGELLRAVGPNTPGVVIESEDPGEGPTAVSPTQSDDEESGSVEARADDGSSTVEADGAPDRDARTEHPPRSEAFGAAAERRGASAGDSPDDDSDTTRDRDADQTDGGSDAASGDRATDDAEAAVELATVQKQLRELGYLVGPADGVKGPQTRAAVMAFQRVSGIQVDGIIGPQTLAALEQPGSPQLRGGPATRIEIDLTRQLLHLVEAGERTVTLHVSSGNGRPYTTSSGGTAYGNTPVGQFVIERRIAGTREADLGILYDPLYFYRGWAIHGSDSVPAQPASHGCIRVTRADARWLFERVDNGTPVHLYGGEHVFTPSR